MTKRGRVLRDTNAGPGLLTVDGTQYTFVLEQMWRSEIPPRPGMPVDVTFSSEGTPVSVAAVSESQVAREQAQRALSGALRHSEAVTSTLKSGLKFGLKSDLVKTGFLAQLDMPALAGECLLLLAFFAMPSLTVGSFYSKTSMSGWDATGFSTVTMSATDHGLLSLLSIPSLLAPLAIPFIKGVWARWLNALPVAYLITASVILAVEIGDAGRTASREIGGVFGNQVGGALSSQISGLFSVSSGAYVAFLCGLYLLTRALRRPAH